MKTDKRIIGAVEPVTVRGKTGEMTVLAKVDTGATRTTVDMELAARVGLGPVLDTVTVRAAISKQTETRPLVETDIVIGGVEFDVPAAIADRQEMRYDVIIGMDILSQGKFLVDPALSAGANGRKKFE